MSPKTRENITAIETIPAERATLVCFVAGAGVGVSTAFLALGSARDSAVSEAGWSFSISLIAQAGIISRHGQKKKGSICRASFPLKIRYLRFLLRTGIMPIRIAYSR